MYEGSVDVLGEQKFSDIAGLSSAMRQLEKLTHGHKGRVVVELVAGSVRTVSTARLLRSTDDAGVRMWVQLS